MNPEMLMVETDHDMRNSADILVIDKIAKAIFHIPASRCVQTITRPWASRSSTRSIPFQISMQGTTQQMNQKYQQDQHGRHAEQADEMQTTIDTMTQMSEPDPADGRHHARHGRRRRRT